MQLTQVAPNLAVSAQITEADIKWLADQGFTDIVCNRPDSEHPDDAQSQVLGGMSRNLGMAFHYLPITHGEPFHLQAIEIARLAKDPSAKVLAYCRSGARSASAWAFAEEYEGSMTKQAN